MKLLVIEDDHETAAYLVKGLGESGYTVDRAEDGRLTGLDPLDDDPFEDAVPLPSLPPLFIRTGSGVRVLTRV